jgi:hypothetical protein
MKEMFEILGVFERGEKSKEKKRMKKTNEKIKIGM